MLYLIQVQNDKLRLLKIGYSDNWSNRKSQYLLHNPLTEIVSTREEGDEILEKLFHLRYQEFSYPDYGREWFIYNETIISGFKESTEEAILDWLWDNRLEILNREYFKESQSIQYQIVERLYSTRKEEDLDWRNKFDNIWDRKLCKERVFDIGNDLQEVYSEFEEEFINFTEFRDKMKLYCNFLDQYGGLLKTTDLPCVPRDYQNYVNLLGTKRVRALSYQKSDLENETNSTTSQHKIKQLILSTYSSDRFYVATDIKFKLQEIYNSLGLKKKAKATDLGEYFEIRKITKRIDGNPTLCIELLKRKD